MRVKLRSGAGARITIIAGVAFVAVGLLLNLPWQQPGISIALAQAGPPGTPTARAGVVAPVVQGPRSAGGAQTPMTVATEGPSRGPGGPITLAPEANVGVVGVLPAAAVAPAPQSVVPGNAVRVASPAMVLPPPAVVSGSAAAARSVASQPAVRSVPSLPVVGSGGLLVAPAQFGPSLWLVDGVALLLLAAAACSLLYRRPMR